MVNTIDATCKSFTGDGAMGSDRFLLIKADKKLKIGDATNAGDMLGTGSTNFLVRMEAGSTGKTEVDVANGDAKEITFLSDGTNAADDVKINVSGDMVDCRAIISHDSDLDIGGDVTNDTGVVHYFYVRDCISA